jgi:hypothetical protein
VTNGDGEYRKRLRQGCVEALDGCTEFAELLPRLQGADPLSVLSALREIARSDSPSAQDAARCVRDAVKVRGRAPAPTLPIVHPLDYHWAFASATREDLCSRAEWSSRPGDTVLFLGTPLLHRYVAGRLRDRRCILLDRDARMVEAARRAGTEAEVCDLLADALPNLSASCAFADPPWYSDAIAAFVEAGAHLLERRGTLFVGFQAQLTRPGVSAERAALLAHCSQCGLELMDHDPLALIYETPSFERAALAAAGLAHTPLRWRRGDLLSFTSCGEARSERKPLARDEWQRFEIGQIPIYVNPDAPPVGEEVICSLVEGDILPTVSRRHALRDKAALWTSRNRIFGSARPRLLAEIVEAASMGESNGPLADRIHSLVEIERDEHCLNTAAVALQG